MGALAGADEHLKVIGLGRGDIRGLRQRGIVDRHFAEAKETLPLIDDHLLDDRLVVGDPGLVARHEEVADGIFADLRQGDALLGHLLAEEAVGNLHQHAGAIAHQRIGADSAAMGKVFQDEQPVAHDLVRLLALHMGDEADAAGIVFVAGIVKTLTFGATTGSCFGFGRHGGKLSDRCTIKRYGRHLRHSRSPKILPDAGEAGAHRRARTIVPLRPAINFT